MATIFGNIQGIKWLRESVGEPGEAVAEISFLMGAYTAASDNGQLGGTGTARNGSTAAVGADTLQTILQKQRRDGKTVTLAASSTRVAICAEHGSQAGVNFFADTPAVSAGNLTFNIGNAAGSEINAAAGVQDRPITILVSCLLT